MTRAINTSHSSALSLETSKVTLRDRSKAQKSLGPFYADLCYPSWKDFKWVIRSNHIKDCPVTVEDFDVALKISGKNITALKEKTARSKPNTVARDYVKIFMDLLKLHKEVFLTLDILFC